MRKFLILALMIVSLASCSGVIQNQEVSILQVKAQKAQWANPTPDSALFYIDKAISLSPNDFYSYMIKAEILTQSRQCDKALELIDSMPPAVSESIGGLQIIGLVNEQLGRTEQAKDAYHIAINDFSEPQYSSMYDIHLFTTYWFLLTVSGDKEAALKSIAHVKSENLSEQEVMYIESFEQIIEEYSGGGMLELMKKEKTCPNKG